MNREKCLCMSCNKVEVSFCYGLCEECSKLCEFCGEKPYTRGGLCEDCAKKQYENDRRFFAYRECPHCRGNVKGYERWNGLYDETCYSCEDCEKKFSSYEFLEELKVKEV